MDNISKKPWERLREETPKQFEAFTLYRNLPPSSRSISKVAELWSESGATSRLRGWARENKWKERALAYDDHLDQILIISHEEEVKRMVARHAEEAKLFQSKVHERLENINPDDLKPQELIKWYETAVKIERLSLGVPTENIKQEQELKEVKDEITIEALKNPKTRKLVSELNRQLSNSTTLPNRTSVDSN
jgi:hypothetical protein